MKYLVALLFFVQACGEEPTSFRDQGDNVKGTVEDLQNKKGSTSTGTKIGQQGDQDSLTPSDLEDEEIEKLKDEFNDVFDESFAQVRFDSFYLTESFQLDTEVKNPYEESMELVAEQVLPPKNDPSFVIHPQQNLSKKVTVKAPKAFHAEHRAVVAGKPLNLYILLDDSESFGSQVIQRARHAVDQLVTELWDANLRIFLGGLEGVSGSFDTHRVDKGSKSQAQVLSEIHAKIDAIYTDASNGDERVFHSLAKLVEHYQHQDFDRQANAYLVITDAPNCKNRHNEDSGSCENLVGRTDHSSFMANNINRIPQMKRKHLQLASVYYRQTEDFAGCSTSDELEVGGDQYKDLTLSLENQTWGTGKTSTNLNGNLCGASENLGFISNFTAQVKELLKSKLYLSHTVDTFSDDPHLNIKLEQNGSNYADFALHQKILLQFNNLSSANTIDIDYHQDNNYRRTNFRNILHPSALDGTVKIRAEGGFELACVEASSFSGISQKCRHTGKDVYVKHYTDLPAHFSSDLDLHFDYTTKPSYRQSFEITASTPILRDTFEILDVPAAAAGLISAADISLSGNGKKLTIDAGAVLPPGTYKFGHWEEKNLLTTVVTPSKISSLLTPVCLSHDAEYAINGYQVDVQSGAVLSCAKISETAVRLEQELLPVFEDKRKFKVIYASLASNIENIPLDYPAFENKVVVQVADLTGSYTQVLAESEYQVENHTVVLNTPIEPGKKIKLQYLFKPPLHPCYPLSSVDPNLDKLLVWYGPLRQEARLEEGAYEIKQEDGEFKICPAEVSHGKRIIAGYVENSRT